MNMFTNHSNIISITLNEEFEVIDHFLKGFLHFLDVNDGIVSDKNDSKSAFPAKSVLLREDSRRGKTKRSHKLQSWEYGAYLITRTTFASRNSVVALET